MHIPDGFLDAKTWASCYAVSAAGLGWAFRKARQMLNDKLIPLMGVLSAFVFAAQMLNFPISAGTSGHLLGGVLCAVLLGPWIGAIVISMVLIVQCLIFQDGGVTALGANILNMSFVGTFSGYFVFKVAQKMLGDPKGLFTGVALGAWSSVVIASAACSIELWLSGTVPLGVSLKAMVGVHALIGIGEAVITVLVLSFVYKVRPDLIKEKLK